MESFTHKKIIIPIILLTLAAVAGIGYFFAEKRSEPAYDKKIDQVMFDRENKSPKYVLTLPDPVKKNPVPEEIKDDLAETAEPDAPLPEKEFNAVSLLERIPLTAKLTPRAEALPLPPQEPSPDLSESVNGQFLPRISDDGRKPWIEYGQQVENHPNFFKVGIIIKNLGLDSMVTNAAIDSLPANVSLSFSPYAQDLSQTIKNARKYGHETYIDLLLSSKNFLKADSGPLAMSITQNLEGNMDRVRKSLNVQAPIGGMVINSGIADQDTREQQTQILERLRDRGLLIIDATDENGIEQIKPVGLPRRKADLVIDNYFRRDRIDKLLSDAETIARNKGSVLIAVNPKPVVLHAVNDWVNSFSQPLSYEESKNQEFSKPFALVPVSNLVVE